MLKWKLNVFEGHLWRFECMLLFMLGWFNQENSSIIFYLWKACANRFNELGGGPIWTHVFLHGRRFIHADASLITFCTWEASDIHFGELDSGLLRDPALHLSVHASLHGGWFIYTQACSMHFCTWRYVMLWRIRRCPLWEQPIIKAHKLPCMVDSSFM